MGIIWNKGELPSGILLTDTDGIIPDDPILVPKLWRAPGENNSCGVNCMSSDVGGRRYRGWKWNVMHMVLNSIFLWVNMQCPVNVLLY